MAGSRTFVVRVLADSKEAIAGLKKLGSESSKLGGDMDKGLGSVLKGLIPSFKTVAIAGTAAFGALAAFTVKSVMAAKDAQAEQNRLRQILLTTGGATEQQVVALNEQAKALQNLGVVSAGNISVVQAQLATFDLQASTIERLTPAILDYVTAEKGATASAEDFKAMTNGLAQALQGNFGSLTRTGFVLDETTKKQIKSGTETERSAALVEILNSTYKDFNSTLRNTTEGRLQVLRNGFQDIQEEIGKALLPVLDKLLDYFNNKIMPVIMNNVIPGFQMFVEVLGEKGLGAAVDFGIAAMGSFGIKALNVFESITVTVLELIRDLSTMGKQIGLIGGAIGALARDPKLAILGTGSAIALGRIEADINQRLEGIGGAYDKLRGRVGAATDEIEKRSRQQRDKGFFDWRAEENGVSRTAKSFDDLNNAAGSASKTLKKGKDAVKEYTSAMNTASKAQDKFNDSIKSTDRAQRSLTEANSNLAEAQAKFNQAVAGYGADSQQAKDAQRELDRAQRAVERSGFRVEESVWAIAEAERELAEVRRAPGASADDVRKAEIRLAEAKFSLADATDTQLESTRSLSESQRVLNEVVFGAIPGSALYESLSRAVTEAEERRADALDAVTEALKRQKEAEEALFEAIKKTQGFKGRPGFVASVPNPMGLAAGMMADASAAREAFIGGIGAGELMSPTTVVVNAGLGTSGAQVGEEIYRYLSQYQRLNGGTFDRYGNVASVL